MNDGERRPLRIGVNALYLIPGGVGGTEIYLRSLLPALAKIDRADRYFVFLNRETCRDIVPEVENWRAVAMDVEARNRPARIVYEQTELPFEARRLRLDVMFNPGFTAPLACACPNVTVFHDLQHKRLPENFRWFDLPFWRMLLYGAAHRSKRLIAVSEATRDDLIRFYRLDPEKIAVAPHGVDPVFFDIVRRPSPRPFLLTVSTLHPHKNLDRLLRAFAEFHKLRPEFQLVIAGLRGFHTEALEALRAALHLDVAVRFTGWIPRQELYDLFAETQAFLYPTTFEGFGMPVLEALAAGIPAACSNIQPVSGIAGEAALQFDPFDETAILGAMRRIAGDEPLREKLASLGPVRAATFSWDRSARLTLEAIESANRVSPAPPVASLPVRHSPTPPSALETPGIPDHLADSGGS